MDQLIFMGRKRNYLSVMVLFPLFGVGQSVGNVDCKRVKNGIFYFYPPDKPKGFTVIRKGEMQTEIDLSTGDTTFWKVNWESDRVFNLKFVRKTSPMSANESKFYSSHTTVLEVLACRKDYFVFKGALDSIDSPNAVTDTMWFKPRKP